MNERIKNMKEILMCAVEEQLCHLENTDAEELGEVIDMIKDLEEAEYYHSVVKAMEESKEQNHGEMMYYTPMYYEDKGWKSRGMNGESRPMTRHQPNQDYMQGKQEEYKEHELNHVMDDPREGKSYRSRRMYMEAKEIHSDKATQMKELEKYAQELTSDIVEMVEDASPEEKQYLSKKISALATKINQLSANA